MTEQEMTQRQAAAMRQAREYQNIYRLKTIAPALMAVDLRFIQTPEQQREAMDESIEANKRREEFEEAMREVDEIAPGWKD